MAEEAAELVVDVRASLSTRTLRRMSTGHSGLEQVSKVSGKSPGGLRCRVQNEVTLGTNRSKPPGRILRPTFAGYSGHLYSNSVTSYFLGFPHTVADR